MHTLHDLISFGYQSVVVQNLLFQGVLEVFDILEISRISSLESHELAR